MLEYLKKKSVGDYINLFGAVLALVMSIVYICCASNYALFDFWTLLCLLAVIALDAIMFLFDTPINEYLKVAASLFSGLATALFFVGFSGDVVDYFNGVNFLGRGVPVSQIVTITVFLFIIVVAQIVSVFFGKKEEK